MILAGDIGGTKTLLALYEVDTGRVLFQKRFESASADRFDKLLADFLAEVGRSSFANMAITAAGFGIAGPVTGEQGTQKVQPEFRVSHRQPAFGTVDDEGPDDRANQRGPATHRHPDRHLDRVGRAHFARVDDAHLGNIQGTGNSAHHGRNDPDGEFVANRRVAREHDPRFGIPYRLQHAAKFAAHQPACQQKEAQQRDAGQHKQCHAHLLRGNRDVQNPLEIGKAVVAAKTGFVAKEQQHGGKSHGLRDDGKVNALDA
ncbi:glucokinase [mine drainage metagenome]|uniref:Glucokinase n=1 Tax=mine drainage metagenome TaxID=410659 RepID=A0A1J5PU58_9ZZZZ